MLNNCQIALRKMVFASGCKKDKDENTDPTPPADLQIAVFSDPHYDDPSLGISGSAFEAYLLQDRKMIAQSKSLIVSLLLVSRMVSWPQRTNGNTRSNSRKCEKSASPMNESLVRDTKKPPRFPGTVKPTTKKEGLQFNNL